MPFLESNKDNIALLVRYLPCRQLLHSYSRIKVRFSHTSLEAQNAAGKAACMPLRTCLDVVFTA
jgi:hypothetical protein